MQIYEKNRNNEYFSKKSTNKNMGLYFIVAYQYPVATTSVKNLQDETKASPGNYRDGSGGTK